MRIRASPVVLLNLLLGTVIVLALLVTPSAPRHAAAAAAANAVAATGIGRIEELVSDEVQGKRKACTGFEWDETRRRGKTSRRSLFRQSVVGGTVTQGQEFPFFVEGNVRVIAQLEHLQRCPLHCRLSTTCCAAHSLAFSCLSSRIWDRGAPGRWWRPMSSWRLVIAPVRSSQGWVEQRNLTKLLLYPLTLSFFYVGSLRVATAQQSIAMRRGVLVGSFVYDSTVNDTAQARKTILGRAVVHPNFSADTARYDYMLYAIEPVTLPNLKPIELNDSDDVPAVGENVTVVGYGLTSGNFTTTDRLLKASLTVMNTTICHDVWARRGNPRVHDGSMLCTSGANPARGPCLGACVRFEYRSAYWWLIFPYDFKLVWLTRLVNCRLPRFHFAGDSGGPLFDANLRQVGIVSWGDFRTFARSG
jgi:Trypsin